MPNKLSFVSIFNSCFNSPSAVVNSHYQTQVSVPHARHTTIPSPSAPQRSPCILPRQSVRPPANSRLSPRPLASSVTREVTEDDQSLRWQPEQLFNAIGNNRIAEVNALIKGQGSNLDSVKKNGKTPLAIAAQNGNAKIVRALLAEGADPNYPSSESGATALHLAAKNNHLGVARALLADERADINKRDYLGRTPLHIAAMEGHAEVAQVLLAEPDMECNSIDVFKHTPLHDAAASGHVEVVRQFLREDGVRYNSNGKNGFTAFHLAVANNHIEVVEMMLNVSGLFYCTNTIDGLSPLHSAVNNQNVAIVGALLAKPDMNCNTLYQTNNRSEQTSGYLTFTPLMSAVVNNNETIVRMLARHRNTDINMLLEDQGNYYDASGLAANNPHLMHLVPVLNQEFTARYRHQINTSTRSANLSSEAVLDAYVQASRWTNLHSHRNLRYGTS